MKKNLKDATVLWLDGREETYRVTRVTTESVQWKLTFADGSLLLVPMRTARNVRIVFRQDREEQ